MKSLLNALLILVVLTVLTGIVYPAVVTAIAVVCFPAQAQGSLTYNKGQVDGSRLIAQKFVDRRYFWPRPSATDFSAMPSGGSNLIPGADTLRQLVDARRSAFGSANGLSSRDTVATDMLFTSGSGLDPDISPEAAQQQIGRVARERGLTAGQTTSLAALVARSVEPRQLGFLGVPRVNVLQLNQELDRLLTHGGML